MLLDFFCWPLQIHSSLIPNLLCGPGSFLLGLPRMGRVRAEYWFQAFCGLTAPQPQLKQSTSQSPLSGFRKLLPSPLLALGHCTVPCGFLTPYSHLFNIVLLWSAPQITPFDMYHLVPAGPWPIHLINLFGGLKLNEIMYIKHEAQFLTHKKGLINRTLIIFFTIVICRNLLCMRKWRPKWLRNEFKV